MLLISNCQAQALNAFVMSKEIKKKIRLKNVSKKLMLYNSRNQ